MGLWFSTGFPSPLSIKTRNNKVHQDFTGLTSQWAGKPPNPSQPGFIIVSSPVATTGHQVEWNQLPSTTTQMNSSQHVFEPNGKVK